MAGYGRVWSPELDVISKGNMHLNMHCSDTAHVYTLWAVAGSCGEAHVNAATYFPTTAVAAVRDALDRNDMKFLDGFHCFAWGPFNGELKIDLYGDGRLRVEVAESSTGHDCNMVAALISKKDLRKMCHAYLTYERGLNAKVKKAQALEEEETRAAKPKAKPAKRGRLAKAA